MPFVRSKMLSDAKSNIVLRFRSRSVLTSVVLSLLRGHDLPVNSPAGIVACFDRVEKILNTKVGVLASLYDRLLIGVVLDALVRDGDRSGAC